ncbi:MAG: ABC transporter permease [Akkermansiaceae bacterium]|nr:ABC transporter permease [Akkermansiaceae bacterium]
MSLLRLISTNLRRHRVRTAIGATGIAFGVATMLCVVTILQGAIHMFERILSSDSEMIVFEKNVSDLFFSSVPIDVVDELNGLAMVERAEPALFGIVSSPEQPVITCFGIRTDAARLKSSEWVSGSADDFTEDGNAIVIGSRAAEFLNAVVGEDVAIGNEKFPVAGIIKTENGFEDGGVFMPLKLCQSYFHKEGNVSVATIKLSDQDGAEAFREYVEKNHPELVAMENDEFSQSYSQFKILKTTGWVVGGCAFLLGGLSVANTMIMSVYGRIREIAILRVCGFSRGQIAQLIFGESVMVSLLGVILGIVLSKAAMLLLKSLPFLQGYVDTNINPMVVLTVVVLAMLTGMAGALYPAAYGMKIKAAEALRFE